MAELKWSNNAIEDVLEIEEYWQKVSIEYAREIVRGIMEKPDVLKTMPEMGRRVPELGDPSIREIFERQYSIIYVYQKDIVEILTIIHTSKLLN